VFIALVLELCGVQALPFAVGLYLPLSSSAPIFVGGLVRAIVDRVRRRQGAQGEDDAGKGVLFSSGLIAGGSIGGLILAIVGIKGWDSKIDLSDKIGWVAESPVVAFTLFVAMAVALGVTATKEEGKA